MLDIDGVMVPANGWKVPEFMEDGFPEFSNKAVQSLNKIISSTNASILLTTSHKSKYPVQYWRKIFLSRGINAKISKLHSKIKFQSRKDEILNWFQDHSIEDNFVIIDDDKSLNSLPASIKTKLVLTSSLIGLNEELADKAIETLSRRSFMQQ